MTAPHIREWRKARGLTQQQIGQAIGRDRTVVSKMETGDIGCSMETVRQIAKALAIEPYALLHSKPPEDTRTLLAEQAGQRGNLVLSDGDDSPTFPARQAMAKDVPVLGLAAGSLAGAFELEPGPVDYVRRPPALAGARDLYAIYVQGDSMEPLHNHGDLRFVHPGRPVNVGDSVVVQVKNNDHEGPEAYIKRLTKRSGDLIVCDQLNPPSIIKFPRARVVALHKILTMNDLFGV